MNWVAWFLVVVLTCGINFLVTDIAMSWFLSSASTAWIEKNKPVALKPGTPPDLPTQLEDDSRHIDKLEVEQEFLQEQIKEKTLMIGLESSATLVTFIVAVIAIVLSEKAMRQIAAKEAARQTRELDSRLCEQMLKGDKICSDQITDLQTHLSGRFSLIVALIFKGITWDSHQGFSKRGFQDLSRDAVDAAEDAVRIYSKDDKGKYLKHKKVAQNNLLFYCALADQKQYAIKALELAETLRKESDFMSDPILINTYLCAYLVYFEQIDAPSKADKVKKIKDFDNLVLTVKTLNPAYSTMQETFRMEELLKPIRDKVAAMP